MELDAATEPLDQVAQLGFGFHRAQLVHHLVGHWRERGRVGRQGGLGHEDERLAAVQPCEYLGGALAARELAEALLDVLNLERPRLEGILLDEIFHG